MRIKKTAALQDEVLLLPVDVGEQLEWVSTAELAIATKSQPEGTTGVWVFHLPPAVAIALSSLVTSIGSASSGAIFTKGHGEVRDTHDVLMFV